MWSSPIGRLPAVAGTTGLAAYALQTLEARRSSASGRVLRSFAAVVAP